MMLNNDAEGWWVNGSIGKITHITRNRKGEDAIMAELADGDEVEVVPFTWEIYRLFVDGGRLQSEVIGKFTQHPLMLAWAVTIHKGQGKTFERVIIDIGSVCNKKYLGMKAFCLRRNEDRVFRIDRILDIREVE